jgi:hypothetical protein
MKRLIIIVEGQTEKEFVEKSLRKHFSTFGMYDVRAIMIQTSKGHKGGFVNYLHLKNDIQNILKSEKEIVVSTFVDFFKIPTNFPNYEKIKNVLSVDQQIEILKMGIFDGINDDWFLPYIQKHEFEALLFSSEIGFQNWFDNLKIVEELSYIVKSYNNPEDINSGSETSPSKRIKSILSSQKEKYNKIADGNLILEEIGIEKVLEKCPLFKNWIDELILTFK